MEYQGQNYEKCHEFPLSDPDWLLERHDLTVKKVMYLFSIVSDGLIKIWRQKSCSLSLSINLVIFNIIALLARKDRIPEFEAEKSSKQETTDDSQVPNHIFEEKQVRFVPTICQLSLLVSSEYQVNALIEHATSTRQLLWVIFYAHFELFVGISANLVIDLMLWATCKYLIILVENCFKAASQLLTEVFWCLLRMARRLNREQIVCSIVLSYQAC